MQQQTCITHRDPKVSSLGVGGQHVFRPSTSISTATVYLGHFAENQGEHYVSLEQDMADNDNGEEESEESSLEDLIGEYAGSQTEPTEQFQNDVNSQITDGGEERISLQFVLDGEVGLLEKKRTKKRRRKRKKVKNS